VVEPDRYPIATRAGTVAGEAHDAAYAPDPAFAFGLATVLDGIEFLIQTRASDA